MYDSEHPAYKELGRIGREITGKVKPRAVVVFSAHWQAGRDTVQVNTAEITDLIYEYVLYTLLADAGRLTFALAVFMASQATTIKRSFPTWVAERFPPRCWTHSSRQESRPKESREGWTTEYG